MSKERDRLFRQLGRLERRLPGPAAKALYFLGRPAARLIRIPLALLLILGGIFSILPFLGFWMLPLGLLLLAVDVDVLRRPSVRLMLWAERKWTGFRRRRQA